jgi:acetyl-CoA carboxylase biotin carboxyl carrier protein
MPERDPADARDGARSADERAADHQAIDRLTAELLPALIAKLGATGLGELEVREGDWRVRLRRPAGGAAPSTPARSARRDRPARSDDGHAPSHAPSRSSHLAEAASARTESRAVATSPAVGIFQPRADLAAGSRIRAGDRLGAVDMLGVAQEVVAPVDGILGARLVEAGDAVEYGQELLVIEFTPTVGSTNGRGDHGS